MVVAGPAAPVTASPSRRSTGTRLQVRPSQEQSRGEHDPVQADEGGCRGAWPNPRWRVSQVNAHWPTVTSRLTYTKNARHGRSMPRGEPIVSWGGASPMLVLARGIARRRLATAKTAFLPGAIRLRSRASAPITTGPIAAPTPYPAWSRPVGRPFRRRATAALKPVSIPPAPTPQRGAGGEDDPPRRRHGDQQQPGRRRQGGTPRRVPRRPHRLARRPVLTATIRYPAAAAHQEGAEVDERAVEVGPHGRPRHAVAEVRQPQHHEGDGEDGGAGPALLGVHPLTLPSPPRSSADWHDASVPAPAGPFRRHRRTVLTTAAVASAVVIVLAGTTARLFVLAGAGRAAHGTRRRRGRLRRRSKGERRPAGGGAAHGRGAGTRTS